MIPLLTPARQLSYVPSTTCAPERLTIYTSSFPRNLPRTHCAYHHLVPQCTHGAHLSPGESPAPATFDAPAEAQGTRPSASVSNVMSGQRLGQFLPTS
jgi:hypothetical protein